MEAEDTCKESCCDKHVQLSYCNRTGNESTRNQNSSKPDDPFDLSSEEELSHVKYQPLKRKPCQDCPSSNLEDFVINDKLAQSEDRPRQEDVAVQDTSENKKLKTSHRVAYVHSEELLVKSNELIRIGGRVSRKHLSCCFRHFFFFFSPFFKKIFSLSWWSQES